MKEDVEEMSKRDQKWKIKDEMEESMKRGEKYIPKDQNNNLETVVTMEYLVKC